MYRVKATGIWPCKGGLNAQDAGLVHWYMVVNGFENAAEYNQMEKIKREQDRVGKTIHG